VIPQLTRFVAPTCTVVLVAAAVSSGSASGTAGAAEQVRGSSPGSTALATSLGVIESELTQLADGRAKLKSALGGVAACTVSPAAASRQLDGVIANRTGIVVQLRSLPAPSAEAAHVKTLLQTALGHSLAADRHYRAWLVYLERAPHCSTTSTSDLAAAQREDVLATAAKRTFVAAFNPLARRLQLATWEAARI
jgi:hypothetical protein